MKYFSSLIAFVMIFACLSVAYADVALPPRPRNVQSDFITADVDDNRKLSIKFNFPSECIYKYQLINRWKKSDEEIKYLTVKTGEGTYKPGDTVEEVIDLEHWLMDWDEIFVLRVQMYNVVEQTRFGTKIRQKTVRSTKTILIRTGSWKRIYDLRIYDGEPD